MGPRQNLTSTDTTGAASGRTAVQAKAAIREPEERLTTLDVPINAPISWATAQRRLGWARRSSATRAMSPFQTAGVAISKNLERVASALLRAVEEADQVVDKAKSTRPGDAWPITVSTAGHGSFGFSVDAPSRRALLKSQAANAG